MDVRHRHKAGREHQGGEVGDFISSLIRLVLYLRQCYLPETFQPNLMLRYQHGVANVPVVQYTKRPMADRLLSNMLANINKSLLIKLIRVC